MLAALDCRQRARRDQAGSYRGDGQLLRRRQHAAGRRQDRPLPLRRGVRRRRHELGDRARAAREDAGGGPHAVPPIFFIQAANDYSTAPDPGARGGARGGRQAGALDASIRPSAATRRKAICWRKPASRIWGDDVRRVPGVPFVMSASEAFDVIVIGFGYAGAIAAIEAHDAGASVLLLEKQPDPGGISVCSAGGLRIAKSADDAFAYLAATNAGTAPEPVLRRLAQGMTGLADYVAAAGGADRRARERARSCRPTIRCPAPTPSASSMSRRCRASMRPPSFPSCAARPTARGCSRWCARRCGGAAASRCGWRARRSACCAIRPVSPA